jgi:S1-C subfamily serine protease
MPKIVMLAVFVVPSLTVATANAQVMDAQTQIYLRQGVAASEVAPVATLEAPRAPTSQAPFSDIGATVRPLRPEEAAPPKLAHGVAVESVAEGGPAFHAGLRPGDIIFFYAYGWGFDETALFMRFVHDAPPHHLLPVTVVRNGAQVSLKLIPEATEAGGKP